MSSGVKTILGIGNALTDILAVLPDDTLLKTFHLPKGSMQHVDMETGDKIWAALRPLGVKYVAGGSAANTITCTSILGMPSSFIGKIGDDELGHLFKSDQEQYGVKTRLLYGEHSSGRSMVFVTGANAERTFAVYLGAALDLVPSDLRKEWFEGYDYFHIEGYLVQNQQLIRRAVEYAHEAGCIISLDMASYNVVESNLAFLHDIVEKYVDIDVGILENGQYNEDWKYIHTMPELLGKAARELGAGTVITVHHSKYALSRHRWDEPLENELRMAREDSVNLKVLEIGVPAKLP